MDRSQVVIASVGDSHAYLLRAGRATNLLDPGATPWPASDETVQRVGRSPAGEHLEIVTVSPQPGNQLILCADGLWRVLDPQLLAAAEERRDPADICRHLRRHSAAHALENAAAVVVVVDNIYL